MSQNLLGGAGESVCMCVCGGGGGGGGGGGAEKQKLAQRIIDDLLHVHCIGHTAEHSISTGK